MDAERYFEESVSILSRLKESASLRSSFLQVQRLLWEKSFFRSRFPVGSVFLCAHCHAKTRDLSFCLQCGKCLCSAHFGAHSCRDALGVDILTHQLFAFVPGRGRRFAFDAYVDHMVLAAKLAVVDGLPLTADSARACALFPAQRQPYPLFNMGNTCWLNAMLQCFAVNPYLQKWFLSQTVRVPRVERAEDAVHLHLVRWFLANFGDGSFSIADFVFAVWTGFPAFANQQQNDAHEFWMQFRARMDDYYRCCAGTTVFSEIFQWKYAIVEACERCGFARTYLESATDLIILTTDSRAVSELLPEYFATSVPGRCGCSGSECRKQMFFSTLPPVLTVALTRTRNSGPAARIEETLDMAQFLDPEKRGELSPSVYKLNSMVVRPGVGDKGHYWANVCKWGQWYRCDDFTITPITIEDAKKDDGCLLFYTRNGFFQ